MKYTEATKMKAVALREKGLSYGEIGYQLGGIKKSTLSYWLKDIPVPLHARQRLYDARVRNLALGVRSARARRESEVASIIKQAQKELPQPISRDTFTAFGAALYWAEGTKRGQFEITNSDPLLIYFMIQWIKTVLEVPPSSLRAKLNMHTQQKENDLKRFWSELCGIPTDNFRKSYLKPASKNKKRNNLYYGTIKIIVPRSSNMKYRTFGYVEAMLTPHKNDVDRVTRKWQRLQEVERPINLS